MVAMRWGAGGPAAPDLKLLQLPGAGLDGIDFSALPPRCQVCNVYEHETGIAEYVMLAMLQWCIRLGDLDTTFRRGDGSPSVIMLGPTHGELAGRTVGILGLGHIGGAVARRAKAFDMRVLAITRRPPEDAGSVNAVHPVERLDEALPECDFLVIACPLTPATKGLLDRGRLAMMKPSAVLINVARAAIVVEDDLYAALKDGIIGGAVLDVWYRYPEPGGDSAAPSRHPFAELDNVYMTPHASGWTDGLQERRWTVIADNMDRLAQGRPLRNRVAPGASSSARGDTPR